jgi:hypothetical protein
MLVDCALPAVLTKENSPDPLAFGTAGLAGAGAAAAAAGGAGVWAAAGVVTQTSIAAASAPIETRRRIDQANASRSSV